MTGFSVSTSSPQTGDLSSASRARVQLIVGQQTERRGEGPGGEGVRAVALMEEGEGRFELWVLKVQVEAGELLGHQQSLIDQGAMGKRGDIAVVDALGAEGVLGLLAHQVQRALIVVALEAEGRRQEELRHVGAGGQRLVPQRRAVQRHPAPAQDAQAAASRRRLQDVAGPRGGAGLVREEDHPHRQGVSVAQAQAQLLGLAQEETAGDLHQDAGAVAGLGVGVDGAAVGEVGHRLQGHLHDVAAGGGVGAGDKAHAAAVLLEAGVVERAFDLLRVEHATLGAKRCYRR